MKTCETDSLKSIWHGVMRMERVEPNYISLSDSAKDLLTQENASGKMIL